MNLFGYHFSLCPYESGKWPGGHISGLATPVKEVTGKQKRPVDSWVIVKAKSHRWENHVDVAHGPAEGPPYSSHMGYRDFKEGKQVLKSLYNLRSDKPQ